MTTTKLAYCVAAFVPFGCILLACIGIAHVVMVARRERREQQHTLPA
jgi:hypothetical protein